MPESQQPRLLELAPKKLVGISQTMSRQADQTPALWGRFMPQRGQILNWTGSELISMQVYPSGPQQLNDPAAEFTKWAVAEVSDYHNVPAHMETYDLSGGLYAVFTHHGPARDLSTFMYIFTQWLPNGDYELDDREHFECLPPGYDPEARDAHEDIFIPVKLKAETE